MEVQETSISRVTGLFWKKTHPLETGRLLACHRPPPSPYLTYNLILQIASSCSPLLLLLLFRQVFPPCLTFPNASRVRVISSAFRQLLPFVCLSLPLHRWLSSRKEEKKNSQKDFCFSSSRGFSIFQIWPRDKLEPHKTCYSRRVFFEKSTSLFSLFGPLNFNLQSNDYNYWNGRILQWIRLSI